MISLLTRTPYFGSDFCNKRFPSSPDASLVALTLQFLHLRVHISAFSLAILFVLDFLSF